MRDPLTYRASKRNLCRSKRDGGKRVFTGPDGVCHTAEHPFDVWSRTGVHAIAANGKAKLADRRKMVTAANLAVGKAMAASPRTFTARDTVKVLREFYEKQPNTRVIHRILTTELRAA